MPAFLSRWDRFHLKPFEGIANHHYASIELAVECNPVAPVGRGTLSRRLAAAEQALVWLSEQCGQLPAVKRVGKWRRRPAIDSSDIVIATGSSHCQALPDKSVKLVLTDPPFFDNVQYGELARIFHAWLGLYRDLPPFNEKQEAVPNRTRGIDATAYERAITACLRESHRTLRRDGRLILTFHNKKIIGWKALAGALSSAGFVVSAIAVVRAENAGDHCKRDVESLLDDLVVECVPQTTTVPRQVNSSGPAKTVAEKNLLAMGLALANAVNTRDSSSILGRTVANWSAWKSRSALSADAAMWESALKSNLQPITEALLRRQVLPNWGKGFEKICAAIAVRLALLANAEAQTLFILIPNANEGTARYIAAGLLVGDFAHQRGGPGLPAREQRVLLSGDLIVVTPSVYPSKSSLQDLTVGGRFSLSDIWQVEALSRYRAAKGSKRRIFVSNPGWVVADLPSRNFGAVVVDATHPRTQSHLREVLGAVAKVPLRIVVAAPLDKNVLRQLGYPGKADVWLWDPEAQALAESVVANQVPAPYAAPSRTLWVCEDDPEVPIVTTIVLQVGAERNPVRAQVSERNGGQGRYGIRSITC